MEFLGIIRGNAVAPRAKVVAVKSPQVKPGDIVMIKCVKAVVRDCFMMESSGHPEGGIYCEGGKLPGKRYRPLA